MFAERIENCRRLALEFQYFIVRTHALRKVFISIKGIYFQAEVFGQTITWIIPHRFNQQTSSNVDYQVMTTFLEFHEVLMGFVNYKLFNSLGIKYPLVIDAAKAGEGENLKALVTESITDNSSATTVPKSVLKATESRISTLDDLLRKVARDDAKSSTKMDSEEAGQESSTTAKTAAEEEAGDIFDEDQRKEQKALEAFKNLFSGCVFFLSREVPRENIEFIVRAFGGQVSWDGGSIEENSNTITHQIVDRGVEPAGRRVEREYVQPQWVFDCVNARILLPVDLYGPTSKLPPHLSPFVDAETEGYTPEFQRKIEEYIRAADGASSAPSTIKMDEDAASEESEESEDEETTYARELAAERKGKYAGDDEDEQDDEEETAAGAKKRRNGSNGMDVVEETAEADDDDEEEEEEIIDEQDAYMAKHSLRNRGIRREYDHLHNKKRTAAERDDDEALAMAQSMLPNKKRKLLEHLQRGKRRGEDRAFHLDEKRRKLANKQLSVDERGILVKKK
jgi:pescadillo protein